MLYGQNNLGHLVAVHESQVLPTDFNAITESEYTALVELAENKVNYPGIIAKINAVNALINLGLPQIDAETAVGFNLPQLPNDSLFIDIWNLINDPALSMNQITDLSAWVKVLKHTQYIETVDESWTVQECFDFIQSHQPFIYIGDWN